MGAAAAIKAGAAYVSLFARDDGLTSGLKAAEKKVKAFATSIASAGTRAMALGGMITAPLLAAARSFAESGSDLYLMSQRTGIAVEALSGLTFAASQSGVAAEDLEGGLNKMMRKIQEAADGSRSAQ